MSKEFDVDMNRKQEERIRFLENKYAPHKLSKDEKVSKEYKSEINCKQYKLRRYFEVKSIAHKYNFNTFIVEKTMFIIEKVGDIKNLHRRAKIEQIIASILLFSKFEDLVTGDVDKTQMWEDYDLNWKLYSIVIANLLKYYRKNEKILYGCTVQELLVG